MPGKIKVKILAGRNLPVMDRSGDTTDAYVEIKFGNTTYKTDVCRKSLNPQWNSEWYRFEVDDAELQDEPLQVRLMDHDTYSANDAIGKVYVNLNPLLLPGSPLAVKNIWTLEATMNSSGGSQGGSVMTGWIPVFDTMHGIRGEVNIIVKVELFSDCNKFRQSSCGVQFFYSPNIPHGYHAQVIHGFVEELVVSDDPEYKWIDKIRTPRASNEARQTLFFKLSGEVQRKIGLKALDLGGNAVIGYVQNFDLEGESGIVARGIGTAVTLVKLQDIASIIPLENSNIEDLTCFGFQSKNPLDFSESDDSLPLLANSPNHSPIPRSPIHIRPTAVGQKFPSYEKSPRHHRRGTVRVAEYRAAGLRSRQYSLQNNVISSNAPMRKGIGSSLSLSEDVISESSLKNMLALEDMRGEPAGNPFYRGFKNFRYFQQNILPKRVAQLKSKFADSLDDESDLDSNYSSTWSLAGSESNRSSIADLRQSMRRKKFTHKKSSSSDGIAALLIRSVHTGFPLDSVIEDRETPAPSPVNFIIDATEYRGEQIPPNIDAVTEYSSATTPNSREDDANAEHGSAKENFDSEYTNDRSIPMISSSETDTSSSDDEEPSDSSTNYNILDETFSLIQPNSSGERDYDCGFNNRTEISKICDISDKPDLVSFPISLEESFEDNHTVEIVRINDQHPNFESLRDHSLESSTDYNILDDTSSLLESKCSDDPKSEPDFHRNAEHAGNDEEAENDSENYGKTVEPTGETPSTVLTSRDSEFRPDCHSLETASLMDRFWPENEKLSMHLNANKGDSRSLGDSADWGLNLSSNLNDDELSLKSNRVPEIDQYFAIELNRSIDIATVCSQRSSRDEYFSQDVDGLPSIFSIGCGEKLETLEKLEHSDKSLFNESFTPSPIDENFHSITDNILDKGQSPIESGPLSEGNSKPFDTTLISKDFPETDSTVERMESLRANRMEKASAIIEDVKILPIDEYFVSESRGKEDANSSTDYNVLDEHYSPNHASSFERTNLNAIIQSTVNTGFGKINDVVSSSEENLFAPFSTTSFCLKDDEKNVENLSTKTPPSSIQRSSSSLKSKHLKFLPKQKHFDSAEDLDFVTSTPVDTDDNPPDFSPIVKSLESVDLENKEVQPLPSPTIDLVRPEVSDVANKNSVIKAKQTCPLGVSFEETLMASDARTGKGPKVAADVESTRSHNDTMPDTSSVSRKPREVEDSGRKSSEVPRSKETSAAKASTARKAQRKVERSDTVIYKGPAKDREKFTGRSTDRDSIDKTEKKIQKPVRSNPIPIIVAPPPEDRDSQLQVPAIQTTDVNVHSTYSADETANPQFADEFTLSEKFNRKYRQHCMLDLIKTIDTKMMTHHMHNEKRDSTRSKQRKKRERMNASATPSPDSIHRTKPHRRRSRSRSLDRQHVHARGQVSTLSTHSFPMKNSSSSNLVQTPQSSNSSCENVKKNNSVTSKDLNTIDNENTVSHGRNNNRSSDDKLIRSEAILSNVFSPHISVASVDDLSVDGEKIDPINESPGPLVTKDFQHPSVESQDRASSLECFCRTPSFVTKNTNASNTNDGSCVACSQLTHRQQDEQSSSPTGAAASILPSSLGSKIAPNVTSTKTAAAVPNMHRRSSDSDLSITPKGNSLAGSDRSMGGHLRPSTAIVRTMNQDTMEMLEYPFITMQQYPPGFILNIGGLVSARSVKLLERITNLEEPEGRDAWWTEIRMEVRSHARALACNVVLGYKEEISICDDVCVLNASGTAAVINLLNPNQDQDNVLLSRTIMTTSVESERDKVQVKSSTAKTEKSEETVSLGNQMQNSGKIKRTSESNDHEIPYLLALSACSLCHLPYNEASVPFRVDVSKCSICKRAKVPDVLFTTIELPENMPMTGRGVFLQATICKCKRDLRGELNAKEISDCLPFLEYELHSLLLNKLKVKGMNAIFGLKVQVSIGERLVIGMAVGTAVYLTALPTPSVPQIASGNSWHNEEQLAEIQKTLIETVRKNREFYRLKPIADIENGRSVTTSDTDESDDDLPDLDLGIGTKDACVLEVDDVEDMDRINLLIDEKPPDDFHVVNTQTIPGLEDLEIVRNLQMFTQISRAKIPAGQFASMPSKYFARMLQTVLFKLRRMVPCALCDMQFKVALPEQDEIQLSVVGMALGLGEPTRFNKYKRKLIPNSTSRDPVKKMDEADLIFSLDEDQVDIGTSLQDPMIIQSNTNASHSSPLTGLSAQKHRPRSPFRTKVHSQHKHKHVPLKERYGVDITPLSYLPSGKIERYLGNLNFFFIRESTSIRENGGLSGFTHSFVTEILAIVRAHITALGGNAMVAFFMTQCVLLHSPHKNQGQCLINVGGDVVTVSYYGDDKYQGNQNC